jgi:hypothetical protein
MRRFFFFRAMSGLATSIDEVGAAKPDLRALTDAGAGLSPGITSKLRCGMFESAT